MTDGDGTDGVPSSRPLGPRRAARLARDVGAPAPDMADEHAPTEPGPVDVDDSVALTGTVPGGTPAVPSAGPRRPGGAAPLGPGSAPAGLAGLAGSAAPARAGGSEAPVASVRGPLPPVPVPVPVPEAVPSAAVPTVPRTVFVVGLTGGAGATTVAALLLSAARPGSAAALDHSGGGLAARLSAEVAGGAGNVAASAVAVHDVGPHPLGDVVLGATPDDAVAVVAPATPLGERAVDDCLARLRAVHPGRVGLTDRVVVVLVGSSSSASADMAAAVATRHATTAVVSVPHDRSLRRGGPVRPDDLGPATSRAVDDLRSRLRV